MDSVVLITTALKPPPGLLNVAMVSDSKRLITAKSAALFWAAQGIKRIVITDATDSVLFNAEDLFHIERLGIAVEQLHFTQDVELVRQRGKGFGEGEIIKFALRHSALLREKESFYKCTGKLICRNIAPIDQALKHHRISTIFWKYFSDGSTVNPEVDARFYFTSRAFAEERLLAAYGETDDRGLISEVRLRMVATASLKPSRALRPFITGFSGGTDTQYFDSGLGAFDFSCPCWLEGG